VDLHLKTLDLSSKKIGFQPSHGGVGCRNHPQYVPFSMSKGWVSEAPHHPRTRDRNITSFCPAPPLKAPRAEKGLKKPKIAGQAKDTS
jgi:hypothetical protein